MNEPQCGRPDNRVVRVSSEQGHSGSSLPPRGSRSHTTRGCRETHHYDGAAGRRHPVAAARVGTPAQRLESRTVQVRETRRREGLLDQRGRSNDRVCGRSSRSRGGRGQGARRGSLRERAAGPDRVIERDARRVPVPSRHLAQRRRESPQVHPSMGVVHERAQWEGQHVVGCDHLQKYMVALELRVGLSLRHVQAAPVSREAPRRGMLRRARATLARPVSSVRLHMDADDAVPDGGGEKCLITRRTSAHRTA